MRLPVLFNPASGSRPKDPDALLRLLPAHVRERVEMRPIGPPWDYAPAIDQARRAEGPLLVWGGDGTLHHAARALLEAGCPVPLGAIPGGSGNGLVRGLRTPLEPEGALQRLLEGRELRIDLPRLDGVPFLNVCGTGFEAAVAHAFAALPSRGFLSYARTSLRLWRSWQPAALRWDAARPMELEPATGLERFRAIWQGVDPDLPLQAWSLCFANLPQYGSALWIAPKADPTDGALQWATLARPSWFDLLAEVPVLFREGGHTPLRQEGRILKAVLYLDRPLPWHLDGEPAPERDRAELTLDPRAFRLQVTGDCLWA